MSKRRRSDVDYCRYGGRRTDVDLTSVCLLGHTYFVYLLYLGKLSRPKYQ